MFSLKQHQRKQNEVCGPDASTCKVTAHNFVATDPVPALCDMSSPALTLSLSLQPLSETNGCVCRDMHRGHQGMPQYDIPHFHHNKMPFFLPQSVKSYPACSRNCSSTAGIKYWELICPAPREVP